MYYIYRLIDKNRKIIYVGKSKNLKYRMNQHIKGTSNIATECFEEIFDIEFIAVNTKTDMDLLEIYFINYFKPKYNKANRNDEMDFYNKFEIMKWNKYNENYIDLLDTWNYDKYELDISGIYLKYDKNPQNKIYAKAYNQFGKEIFSFGVEWEYWNKISTETKKILYTKIKSVIEHEKGEYFKWNNLTDNDKIYLYGVMSFNNNKIYYHSSTIIRNPGEEEFNEIEKKYKGKYGEFGLVKLIECGNFNGDCIKLITNISEKIQYYFHTNKHSISFNNSYVDNIAINCINTLLVKSDNMFYLEK